MKIFENNKIVASLCCKALVKVVGRTTLHYECLDCGKPCNIINLRKDEMSNKDLLEYIKKEKWFCYVCANLKEKILKNGLKEIDNYNGMICSGIQDMFVRRGRW